MTKFLFIPVLILSLSACQERDNKPSKPIVSVFDYTLTKAELADQIEPGISSEDSVTLANNIIESWIKSKMLIAQAERNLPDSLKDFTKQLEAEKNNLLIYTYENEYLSQKMDTLVTDSEILEYYEENKASFGLRDYIVKFSFVQAADSESKISSYKLKNLLSEAEEEPTEELQEFCSEIGGALATHTESWLYFQDFLQSVPIDVYKVETFLKKQKFVDFEADNFRYFVYIYDYELKNAISPLELVQDRIKSLILNRRKQTTIKSLRTELYQKAVRENKIKFYK